MRKINKVKLDGFYQSKYNYYRIMSIGTVIVSVLASTTYWISDCQLFKRAAMETLFPRLFMLIPLIIYLITVKYVHNYKIIVPFSYAILHGIMWCTIWSIYYLPIKQHANEGFIIMHLMFLALGFCAPIKWSVLFHSLLIVDILVSYPINHYEGISLMLSLGIPVLIAVEVMLFFMENAYVDQYLTKKELERMTMHDQLTNAFNRNKLYDLCVDNTKQLKFDNAGIMIMDIDFFKRVNDTYGHHAGDMVLKSLVEIIKSCIRDTDYVIRWGGEEFVVILAGCGLKETKEVADRIRKKVEAYDREVCKFTVSIGIARYNGSNFDDSVKDADRALYYAKQHGRNQVATYENTLQEVDLC